MKIKIVVSVVAVVAIAALIFGYLEMSKEREADATADQPISARQTIEQTNGVTVVHLDLKAQEAAGLKTAALTAVSLPPEIKAYGRVLDSAALVALHSDIEAARAALQASKEEYDRLKKLSAQDNTSAHALETAKAELERDRGALATAEARLVAAAGKALTDEPDGFFQSLVGHESVLVRLDLPADEVPDTEPTGAKLEISGQKSEVGGQSPFVEAGFVCRAAAADPQVQGVGFIFIATNAPATLSPGLAVTGFLQLLGEPLRGVVVPDAAAVRSDGRDWIYVQTGATDFERREITPNRPASGGWFLTNGVAPGDKVVVTGAQTLLSEERKSQIQLED